MRREFRIVALEWSPNAWNARYLSDPNATLNITVEINAEFPMGASDAIKRAVTENATSLGFKTKVWE